MSDTGETGSRRLKSVGRSFEIIEFLWENRSTTLSEVADHFEMPMSTAHIHLATLVESEYVVKQDNEYRCSFRFLRTGGELRDGLALYQAAKPEVDELRESLGEHANLAVADNAQSVQLYKSQSPESIDDNASLGAHLHLHSTATGKAILSELSEAEVDDVVERVGLPQITEDTITDRDALSEELKTIRDRGYSVNRGEHFPGVSAVATSIVSNPDDIVGAISVSGPISRMGTERVEEQIAPALLNKKNVIELKIKQY